jgi:hypothetical protein
VRPYDAPDVDPARVTVPEPTPEYASTEEAGLKLVYHPLAREKAHVLLSRALAIRTELSQELGRDVLGAVEIRVAAAPAQMAGLAPIEPAPGAAAAAFPAVHLVVTSLGSPGAQEMPDLEERLRHALAHLALDEAVAGHDVPRWFHEGYAVHASGEESAARSEALVVAALRDRLLGLRDVEARFPEGPPGATIAAAEAADFVRFLLDRPQRDRFPALIEKLREGEGFERAIASAYGGDVGRLEQRFRKDMAKRYSFVPVLLGATSIWLVVALGIMMRRRRLAAQRAQAESERRAIESAARLAVHEPPTRRLPAEDDELAQAIPPDPDVPKVEHDGRWYTLH